MIRHDRFFLDRIRTRMLAFESEARVERSEGNSEDYETDKIRRRGPAPWTQAHFCEVIVSPKLDL